MRQQGKLYQIALPAEEQNAVPENFFIALHGLQHSFFHRLRYGQEHIALELVGEGELVRYYIWLPEGSEKFVEHVLRAAYPHIALRKADHDPLDEFNVDGRGYVCASTVKLARHSAYPIQTPPEALVPLFHALSRPQGREKMLVSLVVRPNGVGFRQRAFGLAYRLRHGKRHPIYDALFPQEHAHVPTAQELEAAKQIERKAFRPIGFACSMRVLTLGKSRGAAQDYMRSVSAGLHTYHGLNRFVFCPAFSKPRCIGAMRERQFPLRRRFILTSDELAALWYVPSLAPHFVEASGSHLLPPPSMPKLGRVIGVTTFPGYERNVVLSVEDARRHLHVLGATGTGKTTLLLNLALQDIQRGYGVGIIDPKGDLIAGILERFPFHRLQDAVLLTPDDADFSLGINPLLSHAAEPELLAEELLSIFKRVYIESWGIRSDDILRAALLTLVRYGRPVSLCHVPMLLTDRAFREKVLAEVHDPIGLDTFWRWYAQLSEAQKNEAVNPVLNKLRSFLVRPRVRRLLCGSRQTVDMGEIVNGRKVLLADLSTGKWGDDASSLIGSFLYLNLWNAIRRRASVPEDHRPDFFLYVDEFQKFISSEASFSDTLAQARSYRLDLTLANQHLAQLPAELRDALATNARSRIAFQTGRVDAVPLSKDFAPLTPNDLMNLRKYEITCRLSIDGETSRTFSAKTLPPEDVSDPNMPQLVIKTSRERFGRHVEDIDSELEHLARSHAPQPSPDGVGRRHEA